MLLLAMMAPPAGAEGSNPFAPLIMMALIFVIFYFLLIRPQQQQMKKHKALLEAIKSGDRVLTTGGLFGRVVGVHKDKATVSVQIAKGVDVLMQKSAIQAIVTSDGGEGEKE